MKIFMLALTLFCCSSTALAGGLFSSLEQFNYQTGPMSLNLRSYDAWDEITDSQTFPGVTGLTIQVNQNPIEVVPFNPDYDAFKRRQSWATLAEMVAARPLNALITHRLSGTPNGSVDIQAPGIPYFQAIPDSPVFTISGVTGFWTSDSLGRKAFNFDFGTAPHSFSITLNSFAAQTRGANYFSSIYVSENTGAYSIIDELLSGLIQGNISLPPLSLTFTRGLPSNGGDSDPRTFGFGAKSSFELEGEFGNIFNLADAGLGEGSIKAFVYQNNTQLYIQAVPEAATAHLIIFGLALLSLVCRAKSGGQRVDA